MTDKCPYCGEPYKQRSQQSHAHEFAWLHDAWLNLPEYLADLYPSPDHLRKRALIEAGWYDETITDVGSKAGALRVASMLRRKDDFALVIVRGQYVIERTAKSQSRRAMNRDQWQKSKTAIMEVVASLLGVSSSAIGQEAA